MLTRHSAERERLDPHTQLRCPQIFLSGDLRQIRWGYAKPVSKPLGGAASARLDKRFEFHDASLVSDKPICQVFASCVATKHTERVNITEIRRARLKAWFAKRTLPPKEKSYLSQLIGGKSSFGEKAARRLEQTYEMPTKYLDTPMDAAPPIVSESHAELLECWAWLLPGEKADVLARIKPLAAHNKEAAAQFAPPGIERVEVSMSERRLANHKPPFANRRKNHG